jgi:hypothetical protein
MKSGMAEFYGKKGIPIFIPINNLDFSALGTTNASFSILGTNQ